MTPHGGPPGHWRLAHAAPAPTPPPRPLGPPPLPPGWFGPEWPPTETSFLASLGQDAWIHPLSGPVRRMPRADSRVFGAVRPGERPAECRNGHCGVDLGGEIWGEQVHAVHEGVVDFVQRNANPDRGGEFVRLAHRDGTVFTQYFHLAAIPNGLERGMHVKSGDVIGLLGDTGVKESAPHLHFAISVRPYKDGPERYLDPEPLIALWPVRVPVDGGEAGLVTTLARPGMPLGSAPLLSAAAKKRKAAQLAKLKGGGAARRRRGQRRRRPQRRRRVVGRGERRWRRGAGGSREPRPRLQRRGTSKRWPRSSASFARPRSATASATPAASVSASFFSAAGARRCIARRSVWWRTWSGAASRAPPCSGDGCCARRPSR